MKKTVLSHITGQDGYPAVCLSQANDSRC